MPSISFIRRYIIHQLTSQNQYFIHSPFVYRFYEEVLKNRTRKSFMEDIENLRKDLLKNKNIIGMEDLGAGTGNQAIRYTQRRIAEIAKRALKPPYLAAMLGRIAQFSKARLIIELGTSLGITTSYLSKFCPEAQIFTLEGSPEIAKIAMDNFLKLGLENINIGVGNFDDTLNPLLKEYKQYPRLIYIDGNHLYYPTLRYFQAFLENSSEEDVLIFDDIHWSDEMERAWDEIKKNARVFLSLDLFYFGIVFLKNNRAREDFKIRNF